MGDSPLHERYGLDSRFVGRALLILLLVWMSQLFGQLVHLFLLIFASIVVAVLLRAIADPVMRRTPLSPKLAVTLAALFVLGLLALAGWLFGREAADQASGLIDAVPRVLNDLQARMRALPQGRELMQRLADGLYELDRYITSVPQYAMSIASFFTTIILVVVGGVMLAMRPARYRDGLSRLAPDPMRGRVVDACDHAGLALKKWLLAQLLAMAMIGVLTGLGLWLAGVPYPLALGLFAGLAQFVPIVGPILSSVPGLLLGASEGMQTFLWAAAVYFGVQQLESNFVTPFVQRKLVDMPMALTLFSVIGFGLLFGPLGVLLATPMAVVAFVLVKVLYLRDWLGEPAHVPGEKDG